MVLHTKYGTAPENAYQGNISSLNNTASDIRVGLLDSNHTPATNTNQVWSDVNANEVTGGNGVYTAGGKAIPNISCVHDGAGTTVFDGDTVTWSNSTITASYAVVYDAGSNNLLSLVDFEGSETSENGDFTIEWDTNGIFTISV